ncbi:M35 family metallo-endopeptidase [Pseudoxanthomonas sangjuensis]|uniref:M35 family metallo-endopeptidase n=1 Tax=Pseudoxanthomonas sangjuensis TaxID=1503750 RepID=UPI0013908D5F|nr:M35 family metallo-endopeptidase [Pseudoxanthomonas sangjuensis]KAF1713303.1 protease [Pseudoxanthomonas sangjuensis]
MKFKPFRLAVGTSLISLAIAAVIAAPRNADSNPLQVRISPVAGKVGDLQGAIEVVVTNTGFKAVRVPKWELPSDSPEKPLFRVSLNGKPVAYEGMLVKRGLPEAADFVVLPPGGSYRAVVDLSGSYAMEKSGAYEIEMISPLQHASLSDGRMLRDFRNSPMVLRSGKARVWVDGLDVLGAAKSGSNGKGKPGSGDTVVNGVSYANCSTTQIATAGDAVIAARNYAENAKNYNFSSPGPRYTTWFGTPTTQRTNLARNHFASIDAALDQSNGEIKINCKCNQNYYAYVYPTRPYEIFVCKVFWKAPLTGTDSKAGTLIHETSHFDVVAGTDDIVYGQSGAKNLALSNPDSALNNADSHEYFAENNPFQN